MELNKIYNENCLETVKRMPDNFLNCVVTSPPYYGLRDYGTDEQFGLEETPEKFVENLVTLFREINRVLRDNGTVWLNLGDSYSGNMSRASNNGRSGYGHPREKVVSRGGDGIKAKDLIGIPWRVAFALQADGWYLRQDIIWHKPNPMPESVKDRCTKSHEYIFLLTKSAKYWYDHKAIMVDANYDGRNDTMMKGSIKYTSDIMPNSKPNSMSLNGHERWQKDENGNYKKNKRSVWRVATKPYSEAHFAVYPEELIEPCIMAGCPKDGIVYDPFGGSGTTAIVSHRAGRNWILSELNPEYVEIANKRLEPYVTQTTLF